MKLNQLKDMGAFVSNAPVLRTITWTRRGDDGEETQNRFDVHVRRHSFGTIERLLAADVDGNDRSRSAAYIAESILLGDEASEHMSYEDAYRLEPTLAAALLDAINIVNKGRASDPKA